MSEPFVFDPRCDLCKEPFGAVPCGTAVTFHCRPLATEGFSHCALVLSCEFSGTQREQELPLEGFAGERLCFSGTLTAPELPDLLWYHFRFWREDGTGCLLDKTGYRSDGQAVSWQLTVYQESRTPGWFGAGVTYQIFPDRFCRLVPVDPAGLVGRRWVHEDWDDTPEWRPDPDGEIRNRDFFGGTLAGITSKLDDLKALGVTTLYLCPIFESASNHRYNTADYTRIDPMLSVMVNARHMFYGLSLLDKYKGLGKVRAFLIYVLCDETFSLVSTLEPPEGVARRDFYFWLSLLDYLYWITGTALGGLLGSFLTFDTTGLDFALTALFVVLFLEQWKKPENRPAGVMGILCAAASLAVFGADNMVIPAMVLVLAVLLSARCRLDRSGEEGAL